MKKTILILILPLLFAGKTTAQTYIKGNAAYWALGILNVSVERKLADNWTYSGELVYSPREELFNNNKFRFFQFTPDIRWYPKGAFNGFYVGAYGSWQDYKITKWNYINTGRYQDGWGYGFGAMLGLQTDISDRWNLDVYAGGGWHFGEYKGYNPNGTLYVGWNGSGEWIPYRVGITFGYRLWK